jgi:CheY-like chemotaxis protein
MSVLVIDNDRDIAEVARAVLTDEGYQVSVLSDLSTDAIAAAVGRLEPDVVLLDGESNSGSYGSSWREAAALARRERRVPVVMFSAHGIDVDEARDGSSERSRAADFAGIIPKPFEVDTMLDIVANAAGRSVPFDRSAAADLARSESLAKELAELGAREVRTSSRREWVTFRTPGGVLMQVYWWQTGGAYLVGRYDQDGRRISNVASSYDRGAALEICAAAMREVGADAANPRRRLDEDEDGGGLAAAAGL